MKLERGAKKEYLDSTTEIKPSYLEMKVTKRIVDIFNVVKVDSAVISLPVKRGREESIVTLESSINVILTSKGANLLKNIDLSKVRDLTKTLRDCYASGDVVFPYQGSKWRDFNYAELAKSCKIRPRLGEFISTCLDLLFLCDEPNEQSKFWEYSCCKKNIDFKSQGQNFLNEHEPDCINKWKSIHSYMGKFYQNPPKPRNLKKSPRPRMTKKSKVPRANQKEVHIEQLENEAQGDQMTRTGGGRETCEVDKGGHESDCNTTLLAPHNKKMCRNKRRKSSERPSMSHPIQKRPIKNKSPVDIVSEETFDQTSTNTPNIVPQSCVVTNREVEKSDYGPDIEDIIQKLDRPKLVDNVMGMISRILELKCAIRNCMNHLGIHGTKEYADALERSLRKMLTSERTNFFESVDPKELSEVISALIACKISDAKEIPYMPYYSDSYYIQLYKDLKNKPQMREFISTCLKFLSLCKDPDERSKVFGKPCCAQVETMDSSRVRYCYQHRCTCIKFSSDSHKESTCSCMKEWKSIDDDLKDFLLNRSTARKSRKIMPNNDSTGREVDSCEDQPGVPNPQNGEAFYKNDSVEGYV